MTLVENKIIFPLYIKLPSNLYFEKFKNAVNTCMETTVLWVKISIQKKYSLMGMGQVFLIFYESISEI